MESSSQVLLPLKVVHLDKDDEIQKIPLQPPYYDMAQSETDKLVSSVVKIISVCVYLASVVSAKVGLWSPAAREHVVLCMLPKMNCLQKGVYIKEKPNGDLFSGLYCVN